VEQNNIWYVYKKGNKIIKTLKKPKIELVATFPTEKAADSYKAWLEQLNKGVE